MNRFVLSIFNLTHFSSSPAVFKYFKFSVKYESIIEEYLDWTLHDLKRFL